MDNKDELELERNIFVLQNENFLLKQIIEQLLKIKLNPEEEDF